MFFQEVLTQGGIAMKSTLLCNISNR